MNCKNCGARLKDNAKVCQNCGAFIDDGSGFVLLTENLIGDDDFEVPVEKKKKGGGFKFFISFILVLAIIGAGAYYYFTNIYDGDNKPSVSFESGSGIINDDEKIIYLKIPVNSRIEYIHGVSLYDGDKTQNANAQLITTSYEYTKSIDDTVRCIFFDVGDFDISDSEQYTYTFEMNFSFYGDSHIYKYDKAMTFDGKIEKNVSDIIFDHSMDKSANITTTTTKSGQSTTKKESTTKSTTKSTTTTTVSAGFIYNSFWYTSPYKDADSYTVSAIKFNSDGSYSETHYYKNSTENWKTTVIKGKYEIKDGAVFTQDSEGQIQSYPIDSSKKELEGLTARRYNSVKNAEDFFGL